MVKFFTSDGKISFVKVGAQLAVLVALVLGLVAFVGNNKTITLNVDGKVSSVQTFGGTVGEAIKGAEVELQPPAWSSLAVGDHRASEMSVGFRTRQPWRPRRCR